MDLLQLKYFRVVARVGHMTKAAQELYIAQPSLSQTIGRLEEELGVPLFDRQGRQIRLNQYGKTFLEHVERIFDELETGERKIRDMAGIEKGEVALSVTALRLMPDILRAFLTMYPEVSFKLQQSSTLHMQQQLESGEIDLCISAVPIASRRISWQPLLTEEVLLVVPPDHRWAGKGSIALRDVAQEIFVSLPVGDGLRDVTDVLCEQAGFTPRIMFEGSEPAAIYDLVKAGLGIAFAPALARSRAGLPDVSWLHITKPESQRTLGIGWYEDRYLSGAARAFRQFAIDYFSEVEL